MRKPLLIGVTCIFVYLFMLFSYWFYGIVFGEGQDWEILAYERVIGGKLYTYWQQNKKLPNTLQEIDVNEKICLMFHCFTIKYKVANDKQSYALAANANYPFVAYYSPNLLNWENDSYSRSGIGFVEGFPKQKAYLPIYRQDKENFSTPSAWPELSKGSFIEKYVLSPFWDLL